MLRTISAIRLSRILIVAPCRGNLRREAGSFVESVGSGPFVLAWDGWLPSSFYMLRSIFFDFFGTLVDYSPSRREQGYDVSHGILRDAGASHGYEEFLDLWCEVSDEFELKCAGTHQEFSMHQLGHAFLARALGSRPSDQITSRFVDAYLAEWNKGVRYLPGLRDFLVRLSGEFRLGMISNTSDSALVHEHLRQLGVADLFSVTVTSVEYGFRKPHAGIFQHAMQR